MCQHKLVRRHEVFRFQRIYVKHFNVTNKIKSMFETICIKDESPMTSKMILSSKKVGVASPFKQVQTKIFRETHVW